jgi:predicted dehydrogenase
LLKAAILGLGRIGCGYPDASDGTPRNHLSAIQACAGVEATVLVDPEPTAFDMVRARHGNLDNFQFATSTEQVADQQIDIVAVCGPSGSREKQLRDALKLRPRVVIIEKPLAYDLASGLKLARLINGAEVSARINFPRRFDDKYVELKNSLEARPQKAVIRYGKGIHNYGSHLIDLLLDWFGPISEVRALDGQLEAEDPTLSFWCRMACGFEVVAVAMDGCAYEQFECDFFFDDHRIELISGGAETRIYAPLKGKINPDYTHLDENLDLRRIHPIGGMSELYEAITAHLRNGEELGGCGLDEAIMGMTVIAAILKSAGNGGSLESVTAA